ncbi:MAG: helix-turn-helix transcriptional regulator [Clostridia bacterium]|nr:helix-turn-helix transcriptional regulator [Clostridia bacterium]
MQVWLFAKLKEKGISQAELARRIGLSPRTLCNKFQGKQPFLYSEVVKICIELGITNPLDFEWGKEKSETFVTSHSS